LRLLVCCVLWWVWCVCWYVVCGVCVCVCCTFFYLSINGMIRRSPACSRKKNSDDRIVSLNYPFLNNLETTLLPHEILVVPCLMELLPLYCSIQTLHTCFTVLYSNGAESTLPLRDHVACLILYSTMPQSAIVSMPQFRQPFGSSPEIWHHQSSPRLCSSFFFVTACQESDGQIVRFVRLPV
jgi:hypothetical protein